MRAKVQTKEKSLDIFLPQREEDYICMNLKASLLKSTKLGTLLGALPQLARRDGCRAGSLSLLLGTCPCEPGAHGCPQSLDKSPGACGQTHTSVLLSPRSCERTMSTLHRKQLQGGSLWAFNPDTCKGKSASPPCLFPVPLPSPFGSRERNSLLALPGTP